MKKVFLCENKPEIKNLGGGKNVSLLFVMTVYAFSNKRTTSKIVSRRKIFECCQEYTRISKNKALDDCYMNIV